MAGQQKSVGSFALWGTLLVVSVVYVVGVVLWIREVRSDSCSFATFCLSAEAWGTFLQGLFAPLAFIWLVVSVGIQASELRAQRDEIADNRRVMKEQADFIGAQTRLLEQQYEDQKREREMADFEQCLNALHALLNQRLNRQLFLTAHTSSGDVKETGLRINTDTPRDEFILIFAEQLKVAPVSQGFREPIRFGTSYLPVAREALTLCDTALQLAQEIRGISQFTASRLRLTVFRENLIGLIGE